MCKAWPMAASLITAESSAHCTACCTHRHGMAQLCGPLALCAGQPGDKNIAVKPWGTALLREGCRAGRRRDQAARAGGHYTPAATPLLEAGQQPCVGCGKACHLIQGRVHLQECAVRAVRWHPERRPMQPTQPHFFCCEPSSQVGGDPCQLLLCHIPAYSTGSLRRVKAMRGEARAGGSMQCQ